MDRLDIKNPFYVVEGPFDSMFLPNCIAMAGSDVGLKDQTDIASAMDEGMGTIVFDNEPRNKEIIARMEKVIEHLSVFLIILHLCQWLEYSDLQPFQWPYRIFEYD